MRELIRAYPPASAPSGPAIFLPFVNGELAVQTRDGAYQLIAGDTNNPPLMPASDILFLGWRAEMPVLAFAAVSGALPDGLGFVGVRALLGTLDEDDASLVGFASQLLYWQRTSVFCPVCGARTNWKGGDWGRKCPQCAHVAYPHISPAVLALIHDGTRILLVHKPEWTSQMQSIVAGFVEPQESLEDCVRREVKEEVGVDVTDITYAGSQGWPFPHQLMVGFTARYAGGAVSLDTTELDGGAWYEADALPDLPGPISLSRQLIDRWRISVLGE